MALRIAVLGSSFYTLSFNIHIHWLRHCRQQWQFILYLGVLIFTLMYFDTADWGGSLLHTLCFNSHIHQLWHCRLQSRFILRLGVLILNFILVYFGTVDCGDSSFYILSFNIHIHRLWHCRLQCQFIFLSWSFNIHTHLLHLLQWQSIPLLVLLICIHSQRNSSAK